METNRLPINMEEQLAVRPGNRQLEPELGPPVVALENPAVLAVRVALVVLESLVVPAVRVALAALESRVVPAVRAALAGQLVPAPVRQRVAA